MGRRERLTEQWTKTRSALTTIQDTAADEERELSETEEAEKAVLLTRSKELGASLAELDEQDRAAAASAAIIARFEDEAATGGTRTRARVTHEPVPLSVGEYISLYIRSKVGLYGDESDGVPDARAHEVLTRSLENQIISENLGIVPTFIVGDVIKFVDATRYLVNVMRDLPMPQGGKTFTRPRVTQRTLAGQQVTEFDVLTSQNMTITGDTVTKGTYGTALSISEQDIDWTDPALLQIAVEDMAESYALETETVACAAVQAASTNTLAIDKSGDPGAFFTGVAAGAQNLYDNAKRLPDVMLASIDQWAFLVGLTDSTGRQIFPNLSPVNAAGQLEVTTFDGNPLGLKLVVSPEFTSGYMALAVSRYLERYEQNKGFLQIQAPSTLSLTVAYRGYFATNVQANGIESLTAQ